VRDATRAERDAARLGWSLFPLRLFLGVTFVYGGIQKFSDPGFFHPGAPTYIGTQLRGFANGTPGGFLLRAFAIPHPSLAGAGVALTEIAVGLLIITGLLTRPAAAVGLLLNLVLFLTNSWHTYPYFLGSDIVFVFAWSPFVLVGATGQPSLEPALERFARRHGKDPRRRSGQPAPVPDALTRRRAIGTVLGAVGGATAAVAGVSLLLRGSYRPARTLSASATPHGHTPGTATTSSAATSSSASTTTSASSTAARPAATGLPRGAVKLGAATQVPAGQGATYSDPGDGRPDIVVRLADGRLVAHSAVCTHAGCTVAYQGGQIVCPCHGSRFDAQTGAVITGPAVTPLASRRVIQHAGEIYALPA
jgi:thiosulfate dehydrogenase [quinone] large subunit